MKNSSKTTVKDQSVSRSCIFNYIYEKGRVIELVYLSGEIEALYGLSREDYIDLVMQNQVWSTLMVGSAEPSERRLDEIIKSGSPGAFRYKIIRDGEERWIEEKIFPNPGGQKGFILSGIIHDITEQLIAETKIANSERKFRRLFEDNLAGVYVTHVDGRILDCNKTFATILGYDSPKELMKKTVNELYFEEEDRAPYLEKLRKEGSLKNFTSTLVSKDGRRLILNNNVRIIEDENGELNIIEGTFIDVTTQTEASEQLVQSRQSFKNIVDKSLAAIFIFTEEKLVYTNPIGDTLYKSHLNKKKNRLFDIFPKKYKSLFDQLLNEAQNNIHSYTEISLEKEGDEKHFNINVVEIIHNNAKSQLVMLRDISLQIEYNFQKHRADLAEFANEKLQQEIVRHKKTQEELLDKTSRLKAFHDSAHSLYAVTINSEFKLTSINANFQAALKTLLNKEPKIGDYLLDHFYTDEEGQAAFADKFELTFAGEPQEMISHFPTNTGEFWVESFFYPIKVEGEETKEISIISHNITDKIEIQQQALESEASNRATLLAIPDFIFRLNSKGVFTDSRIKHETLGPLKQFVTTEDFVGKSIEEIFLDEKISAEFMDNLKIALLGEGLHTQHFSFYIGNPDEGNKRFFENRFSKINEDEVVVISRDITESMEYESRLIKSVREKEVLLKEVHHRVKNNLQVINSILNLQSSYVSDKEILEIINESQNRIRSMSYIHEILYQTKDFNSINFDDYVTNLVQNLVHSYQVRSDKVKLDLDIEKVSLALDQAIPCGLILNELISNSLKYAYSEAQSEGLIKVKISEKDKKVSMEVEDFGKGLPSGFDISQTETLGLSLVDSLVDQLDGELICKTDNGTKFLIIFEKQEF